MNLKERVLFFTKQFSLKHYELEYLLESAEKCSIQVRAKETQLTLIIHFMSDQISYDYPNQAIKEDFEIVMQAYSRNYQGKAELEDPSLVLKYSIISKFLVGIGFGELELLCELGAEDLDLGYDDVLASNVSQYSKFSLDNHRYEIREYYSAHYFVIYQDEQVVMKKKLKIKLSEEGVVEYKYKCLDKLRQRNALLQNIMN